MGATIAGRMWPRTPVAGLLTKAARQDLLDEDGGVIPFADSQTKVGWRRGVEWRQRYAGAHMYPGFSGPEEQLDNEKLDDKLKDRVESVHRVVPFIIYGSELDSVMNRTSDASLKRGAEQAVDTWLSPKIASHLWTGYAGTYDGAPYRPGNPSLASQGVDLTPIPGMPVDFPDALDLLLQAFGDDDWPGDVMFHCHRRLLVQGYSEGYVARDGATYRALGSHLFVTDPGYPGTGPEDSGPTPSTATWLFATGPVEWDTDTALPTSMIADERMINNAHARAERYGIVRFHGSRPHENGKGAVAYAVLVKARVEGANGS